MKFELDKAERQKLTVDLLKVGIPTAVLLAGTWMKYVYERGFCSHFGVPVLLITFDTTAVLSLGLGVALLGAAAILAVVFLHDQLPAPAARIVLPLLITIHFVVFALNPARGIDLLGISGAALIYGIFARPPRYPSKTATVLGLFPLVTITGAYVGLYFTSGDQTLPMFMFALAVTWGWFFFVKWANRRSSQDRQAIDESPPLDESSTAFDRAMVTVAMQRPIVSAGRTQRRPNVFHPWLVNQTSCSLSPTARITSSASCSLTKTSHHDLGPSTASEVALI
ncbi:hypothetical protein [Crateriforma conspicua]|uniref:Uncharacterized protein n=1 Tax=Crateriforma conspicua TaxID=2527996 RepID=A0A5C6FDS5_9PLAN|nr:hypothetical protein [Crateriforma conspicua]TWU59610.1 hypothetical protein V7x_55200 [Crateriforma conspicua]